MNRDIGQRIRGTREVFGWSLECLATAARIDAAHLAAFEADGSGSFSTAAITRLARALDVPLSTWLSADAVPSHPAIQRRSTAT